MSNENYFIIDKKTLQVIGGVPAPEPEEEPEPLIHIDSASLGMNFSISTGLPPIEREPEMKGEPKCSACHGCGVIFIPNDDRIQQLREYIQSLGGSYNLESHQRPALVCVNCMDSEASGYAFYCKVMHFYENLPVPGEPVGPKGMDGYLNYMGLGPDEIDKLMTAEKKHV